MAVVQSVNPGEGAGKLYTSRYLDNAGTTTATHLPGFAPRKVILHNITDNIVYTWREGDAAGTYTQLAANGTSTLVTGGTALVVNAGVQGQQNSIQHAVLTNKQYAVEAFA